MKIKCKKCGSDKVALSGRRGLSKILSYLLPLAPYRCRDCWARFWAFRSPLQSLLSKIMAGIVLSLFVFLFALTQVQKDSSLDSQRANNKIVKKPIIQEKIKTIPEEKPEVKIDQAIDDAEAGIPPPQAVANKKVEKKQVNLSLKEELIPTDINTKNAQGLIGVKIQRDADEFKMVLLADRPIKTYETFDLDHPSRLVIDVSGKWKNIGYPELMPNDAKVKRIRIGEHDDKLRIVLDLGSQTPISPHIVESSRGLIITIK